MNEFEKEVTDSLTQIGLTVARIDTTVTRSKEDVADLEKEVTAQGKDIAALKVKSGIWGGISGAVSGVGASLLRGLW
jgi:hypothetical protein